MTKKGQNIKHTHREMNSFPFLSLSLEERLKRSGALDLTNNHTIKSEANYWRINPIDKRKKS